MWTTITVKGDEVKRGDMVSGRVVLKVKRAKRHGPIVLTHKDGYTEITPAGVIQVERLVEDDDWDTNNGRHRRETIAHGNTEQRAARIRHRPERRTRREISQRTNRGSGKGNGSV